MTTTYRTASFDGLKVFYREAGDPKAPTMLLHVFPTSWHIYRDLIPALPIARFRMHTDTAKALEALPG